LRIMDRKWLIFRFIVSFVMTCLGISYALDLVKAELAMSRPYGGIGGEWIFIPMVMYVIWKGCSLIFDFIEARL